MFFQMAWRNIFRNKRRTFVILTAIVIGVWCMLFLSALTRGMIRSIFENAISTLTGDFKVYAKGYHFDPSIKNRITDPETVEKKLESLLPESARWTSRIRVSAIANNARHSAGITLVGIHPEKEPGVSFFTPEIITQGTYPAPEEENGIYVGKALLDKFETKPGHKLIIMSMDTKGEIASRAFRIKGVFRAELESTEKGFAFVLMSSAAQMLSMEGAVSEFSVMLANHDQMESLAKSLSAKLPDTFTVKTWKELVPMVKTWMKMTDQFALIWFIVVFIAMGFGIVNTTLMAVYERMREFGLLRALGMKPSWIVRGVVTESFLIIFLGAAAGNIISVLSVYAFSGGIDLSAFASGSEMMGMSRVVYPVISLSDFLPANLVVFGLGILVSLYPAAKAARFTPVEAMTRA